MDEPGNGQQTHLPERDNIWRRFAGGSLARPVKRDIDKETIMNRTEDIKKRAASKSMNKWIGVYEEEFDLEAEGSTPTERMEDIIEQLRQLLDGGDSLEEIDRFVQRKVLTWYRKGALRGAAELVKLLGDHVYDELPEKIEWAKGLGYYGFDGEKHQISSKRHSIDSEDLRRLTSRSSRRR